MSQWKSFPNFFPSWKSVPNFFVSMVIYPFTILSQWKFFPIFFCFNHKSFFIILITKKGNFNQFLFDSIEICFKIFCLNVKLSQNWLSQWKNVPMFFVSKENGLKIFVSMEIFPKIFCLNGNLSQIFLSQWKIVQKFFVSMVICPKIFFWQVAN